ncbi:MAG: hypothetical protein J6386_07385 [Candidatus Synoicihabitans palmerolidicus]|nr:hypothetical protein [Candidatus Synoicihabitans palmerolidicus]
MEGPVSTYSPEDPNRNLFDIEIMSDQLPPDTYVDANPGAPDNPPDETENFSDRNQQLAQEEPPEEIGDMPSTEGLEDVDSTSIVTGDGAEPLPPAVYVPPTPETEKAAEALEEQELPALAQDPLGGTEELIGDNEESYGTNIVKLPKNPQANVTEKVEGVDELEQDTPQGRGLYYRPDPTRQATRPSLAQSQIQPAVFSNWVAGAEHIGVVAHNALRTTFGEYFNRMLGVIGQGWRYDIRAKIERRMGFPLDGSRVMVAFTLHKDGTITIDKVDGNAGPLWDGTAVEAIAGPARLSDGYGEWPDDMRVMGGDSTPIKLTFYYQ